MVKPGRNDKKLEILIAGEELDELQRFTYQMSEAFGLDRRIGNYVGKRPIGLYAWDVECLLAVIDSALEDPSEYPDPSSPGHQALARLHERLADGSQRVHGL
jgi:hypothetical protein